MIKIHTRLNRAWNNSCFNIEITFLWKSFRIFFLRSPYNNKLTKNLNQRSPHLFIFRSLRSSSIFKLQNFIKFACKQFQLDFNIFTIFYESSSKRDKKESYCRVYRRRGYILQHFSVSHLAKIERERKRWEDFEEYRMKRERDEEDSSEYQQSTVPSILGLGHEWIWQLDIFFLVSSLPSTPSSYLPLSPLLTVNPLIVQPIAVLFPS